jgi:hypothetical protein
MKVLDDTCELAGAEDVPAYSQWSDEPVRLTSIPVTVAAGAATACFHGFDHDDQPLVRGVPNLSHEVIVARSTVPLASSQIGSTVVLLFEEGDPRRPIVVGVVRETRAVTIAGERGESVSAQIDDVRLVLSAEREIVLRCGDASITLTCAGKVLIKGTHIVSRSSGCNKIKGAAVDIN